MPVFNFDVKTFLHNLRATKPPYQCPIGECARVYRSLNGMEFHLLHFDHNNPFSQKPTMKRGHWRRGRVNGRQNQSPTPSSPTIVRSPTREALTYAQAQRLVEVDIDGKLHRLDIYDTIDVITDEFGDDKSDEDNKEKPPPSKGNKLLDNLTKPKKDPSGVAGSMKLPEASYRQLQGYEEPPNVPARPSSYFRFIEKSQEELDEEVEYDMDEEDYSWLEMMNVKRRGTGCTVVSQETFETLMDRLEKESYFQSQTTGKTDTSQFIDEDAVCCICNDGECQNSNVILFCDMCNLAVHQECYGVPYIPEGQWLCRRCLQSPSRAVECTLCPNKGGAFKQTDDTRWAHVVCALWIPEVGFANTVFLEPVDSIDNIPSARWKLACYICKQRGVGACIQCHKTNCYTAFHVTCAQQAGLFMKMEPIREVGINGTSISIRKTAYCDIHTPADAGKRPIMHEKNENDGGKGPGWSAKKAKAQSRKNMRKARKILAEKRAAMPIVSMPCIPPHRISKITAKVSVQKKQQFVQRLISYWTLKRQSRNGVPLLRRLQAHHQAQRNKDSRETQKANRLKEKLKYWQRLRHDLERARLLVELIRKREKLKREHMKVSQLASDLELQPFNILLKRMVHHMEQTDPSGIFAEPVSPEEAPDYHQVIKMPMDFATMRNKVDLHQYADLKKFEEDFNLIVNNCMHYNSKDTKYYRAAVKLRDQGGAIIRQGGRLADISGYDVKTGIHLAVTPKINAKEVSLDDIDRVLEPQNRTDMTLEEQLKELLEKLDMTICIKHNSTRTKRAKQLKREINSIRRQLAQQKSLQTDGCQMLEYSSISEDSTSEDVSETASQSDSLPPPQLSPRPAPIRGRGNSSPYKSPGRGRGRGRGRPRIIRSPSSLQSREKTPSKSSPGKTSESPGKHASPDKSTPTGVGRRTAVLFNKRPANRGGHTPKRMGRPPKRAASMDVPSSASQRNCGGGDPHADSDRDKSAPATVPEHGTSLRKRARSLSYNQDNKSKSPGKHHQSEGGKSPGKHHQSEGGKSPGKHHQSEAGELTNGFEGKPPGGESFTMYRTETAPRSSSDSESSVSSRSSGDSSSGEEDRQRPTSTGRHGVVNFTEDSSGDTSCGESTSTNSRFNVRSKTAAGPVLRDRERRGMNKWPPAQRM